MERMSEPTTSPADHLPPTLRRFLAAHAARDADAALACLTPDAVVVDDGTTYRGAEVRHFLATAGAEFTYTSTLVAAEHPEPDRWVATHRLEGDFPGGVAVLRYVFDLEGERVGRLVIAP